MNSFYLDKTENCANLGPVLCSLWQNEKRTARYLTEKRWKSVNVSEGKTSTLQGIISAVEEVILLPFRDHRLSPPFLLYNICLSIVAVSKAVYRRRHGKMTSVVFFNFSGEAKKLIFGLRPFLPCHWRYIIILVMTWESFHYLPRSPWYNHHGWLGVKNQLSIYLSTFRDQPFSNRVFDAFPGTLRKNGFHQRIRWVMFIEKS